MISLAGFRPVLTGLSRRLFTVQAAAATQPSEKTSLPVEQVQVTKLNNGLTVASLENNSPISRVGVIVNAGSRYETSDNIGVTHCLRNYAHLTSKTATTFSIIRGLNDIGANLEVSTTRDHMMYSIQCLRSHIDTAALYLRAVTTGLEFRPWEVKDNRDRLHLDLASNKDQLQVDTLESLHTAAFRDTLGRSLYAPGFMVDRIGTDMLLEYVNRLYTAENMALVGLGVNHDDLKAFGENFDMRRGEKNEKTPAKYSGGEIRNQRDSSFSAVALAVQGSSLSSNDLLTLALLQHLMGVGPYIKWASHTATSKLSQAGSKATTLPFSTSCFNVSYSDSGLFGMFAVTHGDAMEPLLMSMMAEFGAVTKGNVTDQDLARAKNQLKASIIMNLENQSTLLEDISVQALATGSYTSHVDMINQIDKITGQDVLKIAKRVFNTKMSMAASGDIDKTPYIDQLLTA